MRAWTTRAIVIATPSAAGEGAAVVASAADRARLGNRLRFWPRSSRSIDLVHHGGDVGRRAPVVLYRREPLELLAREVRVELLPEREPYERGRRPLRDEHVAVRDHVLGLAFRIHFRLGGEPEDLRGPGDRVLVRMELEDELPPSRDLLRPLHEGPRGRPT
jgi:hypothetical protein